MIDGHHYAKNETLENAQTTMGNAGNVAGTPTGHRYEGNVAKGGAKIHMGDMDAQAFKAFWGEK